MQNKKIDWLSISVFVVAVFPFVRSFGYGFINIDDPLYYIMPRIITSGLSLDGISWALTDLSNAIWMPVTWIVYQIDHSIKNLILSIAPGIDGFQLAYSIAHIQSVLLHGINAVLLFRLLKYLSRDRDRYLAMLGALLWAVHPLRVESVVWIASLKDVLSMGFLLGALISWVKFRRNENSYQYLWTSNILFFIACTAKPSAMTFPGMIILIDALILGKLSFKDISLDRIKIYLPSILIALPIGLLAHFAQGIGGAATFQTGIPLSYKLQNAAVSIGVYLKNLFWPNDLAVQCQIQWPNNPRFMFWGLVICATVIFAGLLLTMLLAIKLRNKNIKRHYFATGGLWILGSLFPMLGISAFGGHAFADRFTYIPMIGVSIAVLGISRQIIGKGLSLIAVVILSSFIYSTTIQVSYWQNDKVLMNRTLAVDGDRNLLAHTNLARYYFEHEHTAEGLERAIYHFKKAYEINKKLSQESAIIYMFALAEAGKIHELRSVHDDFVDWLHKDKNIWNSIDQDITESLCYLYESQKAEKKTKEIKMALPLKTARWLLSKPDIGVHKINYFIYLVGEISGDTFVRDEGLKRLKVLSNSRTGIDDAVRFRFLFNE
jgi:drug/metabolite transporter superfamily protein YnfA